MPERTSDAAKGAREKGSAAEPVGVYHQSTPRQDIPDEGMRVLPGSAVVLARCENRRRCGFIGATGTYLTMERCADEIAEEWRLYVAALNQCPAGVRESELNRCVIGLREADCAAPQVDLPAATSCAVDDICAGAP